MFIFFSQMLQKSHFSKYICGIENNEKIPKKVDQNSYLKIPKMTYNAENFKIPKN